MLSYHLSVESGKYCNFDENLIISKKLIEECKFVLMTKRRLTVNAVVEHGGTLLSRRIGSEILTFIEVSTTVEVGSKPS